MTPEDAATFERCMAVGGLAVFPADTVYGLACEPDDKEAVRRMYAIKRRDPGSSSAVMFFGISLALEAVPEAGPLTHEAIGRIMPGPVTVLLDNPAKRFPLACGSNPTTLGIRVPLLTGVLEPLTEIRWPVVQTSANFVGEPDARTAGAVPLGIREGCDLVLDAGELTGIPSTVVDLRGYESTRQWKVIREGGLPLAVLEELL